MASAACKSWVKQWWLAACLLLVALTALPDVRAQHRAEQAVTERQVKAAYLAKFGNYVEWPAHSFSTPESPLKIGVLGADMLADDLAQIVAGRTINGRPVTVQKLRYGDPVVGLNVLFIGRAYNSQLAGILGTTKGAPILTVTESEDAIELGSTINFIIINGRVRFEVAPKTAGLGHLNISARLLAAAYKVAMEAS